jgi:exopolyphosphatase / guanosine-5'-triphosphate,3'-diphosphate pyrophosphatase
VSQTRRIAAIDIGTVTTRLLVADVSSRDITEVVRCTDVTHLGQDLTVTGRLSAEAIERVSGVVAGYARTIAELGVERVTALTTSASRDAENSDELLAALCAHGIDLRVIDGEAEARLSFLGATWSVTGAGLLVVDVGGGSTEMIFGSSEADDENMRTCDIESMRSVDVGSRRITEMFLHSDPPTPAELDEARAHITSALRPFFDTLRTKPRAMVSLAGAATTFSAIHMEMAEYDSERVHLSCLTGPQLSDLISMLACMPLDRRRDVVGLHPDRAAVIVGGGLVIETVLALAGLDSTLVSEHDILYGILLDTYRDLRREADRAAGDGEQY